MSTNTLKQRNRVPTRSAGDIGRTAKRRWIRHVVMLACSAALVGAFWATRANWVSEMRLWKAVGDASYVLLLAALVVGPLGRLVPATRGWLRWRRQIGIWFALTATLHAFLILNGWARWSLRRFLGYEFIPQLGREARLEPGFGLANLIGIVALFLALILAATSSDTALRRLGRPAWSWLHRLAQTVLILSLLHGGYFLFLHFTESFHKAVPASLDWFRVPFLMAGIAVIGLQAFTFMQASDPVQRAGAEGSQRRRR